MILAPCFHQLPIDCSTPGTVEDSLRINFFMQRYPKGTGDTFEHACHRYTMKIRNAALEIEGSGSKGEATCFLLPSLAALTGLRSPLPLIGGNLWPSHTVA